MEWAQEQFTLSDDPSRLNMNYVVTALQGAYWSAGRPREIIEESWRNSLCFGLFDGTKQIGFTRIVTDKVIFSWFCDVWIDLAYRGQGLGTWMLQCIMQHPDVASTRMVLVTQDAHGFYEKLGFERKELLVKPAKRSYR
jgi:GNAT superfamily N-acetyltransferase